MSFYEFSIVEAITQVDITKDGDTCEYQTEDGNTITVKFEEGELSMATTHK